MKELGHNDEEQISSLRNFLLPSWFETLLYFAVGVSVVLLFNVRVLWNALNDYSGINRVITAESLSQQLAVYDRYFAAEILGKATVFILWGVIGCISYIVVWAVQHFYLRVKTDADESNFEHSDKKTYWQLRISQHVLILATTFTGVVFSLLSLYIFPMVMVLSGITFENPTRVADYKYILAAIIILVVYFYILSRLWQVNKYVYGMYFSGTDD